MRVHLKVITYQNQPPAAPILTVIDEDGGSLGRAADNGCVLPDPERIISSKHAVISFQDQRFFITDTSTNGLYLDESIQPLGRDNSAELNNGQRLAIGDYVIEINIDEELQEIPASPLDNKTASAIEDDFFTHPAQETADVIELEDTGRIPEPLVPVPPTLPCAEEKDDIGWPAEDNEFFSPRGIPTEPSIPYPKGASEPDNVPSENEFFQPPQSIPDDWDILGEAEPPEQPVPAVQPKPVIGPTPPQPAASDMASRTSAADALKILLKGANMEKLEVPQEEAEAILETTGELLRDMVDGLMLVLRARAEIKSEFRMQLTTIRPIENNPLKFSVCVEDALRHLLTPGNDAYLPPHEALHEALDNIEAHQLAVMAGMQAALSAMLKRFEPSTLERYFENKGGRSLLETKKAWYWEQFEERYKEVLTEAEDNFQDLFGEEFARAYEEQITKLAQARYSARGGKN